MITTITVLVIGTTAALGLVALGVGGFVLGIAATGSTGKKT
jgi:hypothetical protein